MPSVVHALASAVLVLCISHAPADPRTPNAFVRAVARSGLGGPLAVQALVAVACSAFVAPLLLGQDPHAGPLEGVFASTLATLLFLWCVQYPLCVVLPGLLMRPPHYRKADMANHPNGELSPTTHPRWQGISTDPLTDLGLPFSPVQFTTGKSACCRGWLVEPGVHQRARTCVVLLHGTGRDRRAFLRHVDFLIKGGLACLLFDFREHGTSDGANRGSSYGLREIEDTRAAITFVTSELNFDACVVMGTSLGAACAMVAASLSNNPKVRCVVAENPFADQFQILEESIAQLLPFLPRAITRIPGKVVFARIGAQELGKLSPLHHAPNLKHCPVLFIHGTKDARVGPEHSVSLFKACGGGPANELWIAEGSEHTAIVNDYPDEFAARVLTFMMRWCI